MRLWSIHPKYLDTQGLVGAWREGLLAQNVLMGKTYGYKYHPQLIRFKNTDDPTQSIANYLHTLCDEGDCRRYHFSREKICQSFDPDIKIDLTSGQLAYEWGHFMSKIQTRDPIRFDQFKDITDVLENPIFHVISGDIAGWESIK